MEKSFIIRITGKIKELPHIKEGMFLKLHKNHMEVMHGKTKRHLFIVDLNGDILEDQKYKVKDRDEKK